MAAFEGMKIENLVFLLTYTFPAYFLEFGVLPEIAKAIDELEWT